MKLPDFLDFDAFNQLRAKMGASELGHFAFFDPKLNLSAEEREQLASTGLNARAETLRELNDRCLAYKDSRVVLMDEKRGVFHLANCGVVAAYTEEGDAEIRLATVVDESHQVCSDCLQRLRYKGYDTVRHRHRHYSQQILQQFSLQAFFQAHPLYPVDETVQPKF